MWIEVIGRLVIYVAELSNLQINILLSKLICEIEIEEVGMALSPLRRLLACGIPTDKCYIWY